MTLEQGDGLESDGWITRVIRKNRDAVLRIKELESRNEVLTTYLEQARDSIRDMVLDIDPRYKNLLASIDEVLAL